MSSINSVVAPVSSSPPGRLSCAASWSERRCLGGTQETRPCFFEAGLEGTPGQFPTCCEALELATIALTRVRAPNSPAGGTTVLDALCHAVEPKAAPPNPK
jgi:hypothetical protein